MTATAQFLATAAAAYKTKQGHALVEIVLPDLKHPDVEQIIEELLPEEVNIRAKVLESLPHDDQSRLADLMGTVLQYIRDTALVSDGVHMALLASLRLAKIYESATKMFALPDSGWFNECIQNLTLELLESAREADEAQEDNSRDRFVAAITAVTNGPLKTASSDTSYGHALSARVELMDFRVLDTSYTLPPRPRDIVFWLANLLFRNSFELRDTLASAEPILGFLAPQIDNLHRFTKAEQVTFHYYAGSVFLVKEELRPARNHLQLAFELCTNRSPTNKRLIFTSLVTVSILLGIFPHQQLLAAFDLSAHFLPLIHAIKVGDRSTFRMHLDCNMDWFRDRYIYLILRAKGEVLVIRSLFRRAILISRQLWPPENAAQPPTIQFEHLLAALRLSYRYPAIGDMEPSTWDTLDMEAICASLIDQGYIQGYLFHSRSCLVVQRGPTLGFPPVSSVVVRNEE